MIRRLAATLRAHGAAQRVVANSAWLYADNLFRLAVSVAIAVWVARYLGPHDFGLLSYATALVAILGGVASLGLDTTLVKTFLTASARPADILLNAACIRFAAGIAGAGVAAGMALWLSPDDHDAFWVIVLAATALAFHAAAPLDALFRSRLTMRYGAAAKSGGMVASAVFRAGLILGGAGVVLFALAPAVEACIGAILLLWFAHRSGVRLLDGAFRPQLVVAVVRESWPVWLGTVCALLYMRGDLFLLGQLTSRADVGVYAVASKLSEVLYIVPVVLADALFPHLVRAKRGPAPEYAGRAQLFADVLVAATLGTVVLGVVVATPLIPAVFGAAYAPAVPVFWVHAWSALFVTLTIARTRWLVTEGLQRYEPVLALMAAVTVLGLNLLLIPRWGPVGAAAAAVAGSCVAVLGAVWLFAPLRPLAALQLKALWPFGRLARAVSGLGSRVAARSGTPGPG